MFAIQISTTRGWGNLWGEGGGLPPHRDGRTGQTDKGGGAKAPSHNKGVRPPPENLVKVINNGTTILGVMILGIPQEAHDNTFAHIPSRIRCVGSCTFLHLSSHVRLVCAFRVCRLLLVQLTSEPIEKLGQGHGALWWPLRGPLGESSHPLVIHLAPLGASWGLPRGGLSPTLVPLERS